MAVLKLYEQWHDKIGEWLNGTSYQIDIVNYCSLHCHSCALGSIGTTRKGRMTFDTFRRILDRAQAFNKIRHVQLYTYSDALLHPEAHLFIQEMTDRGIESWISTMLQSTKCDWEKVIEARPTELRISFSGWDRMNFYQTGANPVAFQKQFDYVKTLPRHKETTWTVLFHSYRTNTHELEPARRMAEENGMKFTALEAIFMPLEKYVECNYTDQDKMIMAEMWETPEDAAKSMKRSHLCQLWKSFCIDANADVYLCELIFEDRFKIGNFLNLDLREIKRRIKTHPFCGQCLLKGGNKIQECYGEIHSTKDPVAAANKRRRIA